MRILLGDDQPEVRAALRLLLDTCGGEAGWQVVGEAANAGDLLTLIDALAPDVLLLDWELPSSRLGHGQPMHRAPQALLAALRDMCPAIKIVALSSLPEAQWEAQRLGADAFVNKGDSAQGVLRALKNLDQPTA